MFSNFLLTNRDDKDSRKELQRNQQKIVDELRRQCKSFNKERIISQLNNGYQIDRAFHLHVPNEIKHIARKHGLPEVKWGEIYQNLIAENIDDHTKLLLAQTIKYSIKNNTASVKPKELLEVLRKNSDAQVKSEFVWTLSYQLSNSFTKDSKEIINENFIDEINSIIEESENKLNQSSVIFLNDQLQRYFYGNHLDYRQSSHIGIKTSVNYSKKIPQNIVTKNQQTTKIKYKNTQSEESTDKLSSINVFKNLNKKIKMNSNIESLPTIPDKVGSDTSIFRDTYKEVVHLYNTIKSGKSLKKTDKDEYLPSKFIGSEKKWVPANAYSAKFCIVPTQRMLFPYVYSILLPLFIDRMIAAIFLEISKKHMLHENAIVVLMECIDSLDHVEIKIFGNANKIAKAANDIALYNHTRTNWKIINTLMIPVIIPFKSAPDVVANVIHEINEKETTDPTKIIEIFSSQIIQIRLAAISAIYNCARRTRAILSEERLRKIEKCLVHEDIEFRDFVIKILQISNDTNYKTLFDKCLENLAQNINIDVSLDYLYQQCETEHRCQELFNEDIITRVSYLFRDSRLNAEMKTRCCMIINNYLEHRYTKGLNDVQLENYVYFINDPHVSSDSKVNALISIVLTAEKNHLLPEFVIRTLVENINDSDDKFGNFIIVTLGIVS
ncbi:unnamed protein product, partial [Rotaria magnacalcarata]